MQAPEEILRQKKQTASSLINIILTSGRVESSWGFYPLFTGQGKIAIFYGIQTFLSLLKPTGDTIIPATVSGASIADEPRFPYRGLHFDISRNFQTKETIKRLIDMMALYKLNKLQLHMSDDEGWRLEIPGLEELTGVSFVF